MIPAPWAWQTGLLCVAAQAASVTTPLCCPFCCAQEREFMGPSNGDDQPDDLLGVVFPEQAGINLTWP